MRNFFDSAYNGFLFGLKHQDPPRKHSKQRNYQQRSCVDVAASNKVFIPKKQLWVSLLLPARSKEYIRRMYLTHGNLDPWKSATKQRLQKMFIRKNWTLQEGQTDCTRHVQFLIQWREQEKSANTGNNTPTWSATISAQVTCHERQVLGVLQAGSQSPGCFTFPAEVKIAQRALLTIRKKLLLRNSYIQVGALIYCTS